ERPLARADRLLVLTRIIKRPPEIYVREWRERLQLPGRLALGDRFAGAAREGEEGGVPVVGRGVVRVTPDGLSEFPLGLLPVPLALQLDHAQRGVRLGQRVVERQGL